MQTTRLSQHTYPRSTVLLNVMILSPLESTIQLSTRIGLVANTSCDGKKKRSGLRSVFCLPLESILACHAPCSSPWEAFLRTMCHLRTLPSRGSFNWLANAIFISYL